MYPIYATKSLCNIKYIRMFNNKSRYNGCI